MPQTERERLEELLSEIADESRDVQEALFNGDRVTARTSREAVAKCRAEVLAIFGADSATSPDLFGEGRQERAEGQSLIHRLKSAPEPFSLHLNDALNHEIRPADRDYRVGDKLRLREWDGTAYTGGELTLLVTCLTPAGEWGLPRGLCVLGVEHMELDDWNEQAVAPEQAPKKFAEPPPGYVRRMP